MKTLTTFCCAALALCSAIYAQGPIDHMTVHFNSPVLVGETKFPAGDCDIRVMHGNTNAIILVLRAQDGPTAAVAASRLSLGDQESDETPAWCSTAVAPICRCTALCCPIILAIS